MCFFSSPKIPDPVIQPVTETMAEDPQSPILGGSKRHKDDDDMTPPGGHIGESSKPVVMRPPQTRPTATSKLLIPLGGAQHQQTKTTGLPGLAVL